jgi:hypothetical protein
MKRPSRKPAAKSAIKARGRKIRQWFQRHPYAPPRLLDSSTAKSAADLEIHCRSAIRAAWAGGEHGRVKAAREDIARWQLTPANIAVMARALADYNHLRPWPEGDAADEKIEWLYHGSGCCERRGTARDSHIAAWSALSAALSIIVEAPLQYPEDATALLSTLINTGWRHLPMRQQARVARGMARFVDDSIAGRPFEPFTLNGERA